MIFLFSLLPFASIQKQERKRVAIFVIAVGVQITKLSAVRRANIWEKKNRILMFLSGLLGWKEPEITDLGNQAAKSKPKSPQT